MFINQFLTQILNINLEDIEKIDTIQKSDESIEIKIRLIDKHPLCQYCSVRASIHGYFTRKLNHSTLNNRKCTIIYAQRRYKCNYCEYTFSEKNPFINTSESLTLETKINILKDLKHIEMTYSLVAERHNVSVTKVIRIFDKHVNIRRKPLPAVLSMDEHYFPESDRDALYCCLLMDFETGVLIDILPDRKKGYLMNYFSKIRAESSKNNAKINELDNVKYVSIDLYAVFKDIAKMYFPKAIICADSFHVIQNLNKFFDNVRKRCWRNTEDERLRHLLIKFRFLFNGKTPLDNMPKYNKSIGQKINFRGIQEYLFKKFPDLEVAYNLKELYIMFNITATEEDAAEKLDKIILLFADCGILEMMPFYGLLVN